MRPNNLITSLNHYRRGQLTIDLFHKLKNPSGLLGKTKPSQAVCMRLSKEEGRQIVPTQSPARSIYVGSLILFSWIILNINIGFAEMLSTYSINSELINNLLPKIDKTSLVLISIDNTIIKPKSKMFNYGSAYRGFIEELRAAAKYAPFMANEAIAKLIVQRQMILVEKEWPHFINQLKATGALVLGIIKVNPACKQINNFPAWQYQQLSNLGIKFTEKVNNKEIFRFEETNINSPLFYQGIIFTSTISHAATLEQFLSIIHLPLKNIIFFDSVESEIKAINYLLRTVDLDYYGVEYLAITNISDTSSPEVMQFQQQRLLKTGEWLEDEVAQKLMKSE
ncbi:DUF2608 domain-containing protein [Candidatus Tisiphia endosymbiont of Nemotelus uliginosus]|uniref:DUF2608 domain-containing protein n=1 Tax=Candidatus Tisiphia endosymbiont of Nemotelus uliginosus TaxID=3077926 RepID=UPI0035C8FA6E